ncbi:hypothetical protein O181_066646 [Austropuccinia psidii MF-1]|uniref:Uncharacterized protein n=1 Tax=Austropuccinia psidii MF-1 TaxID=1389203 RepID=A0A9Q3I2D3_9BASI|nr:hypothetical protein [Austropuccinia psidii MF-1]
MKLLLLEVEEIPPLNQMDLNQDVQVKIPKDKNVSPEERHKWRMPKLLPVPKAGVGTSAKSFDRHNELLSSSEEVHGPIRDRRASERLDTHVLQGTSPTDKSLVEKPKHFVRGPEEVGPRKGQQPSGSFPNLHKQTPKSNQKGRKNPSGTSPTHRITEFPRRRRQPWTMCSLWKEL